MSASVTVKQFDTWPPWEFYLSDSNGAIDLTNATTVKVVGVGVKTSTDIGGDATIAQYSFTADPTESSAVITSVSSFTNLAVGQTLTGAGIPAGTTIAALNTPSVGDITMSNPASASGTAVAIIANQGWCTYTPVTADTTTPDTYNIEVAIHWSSPSGAIQKIPNAQANNPQIEVDPDLTGASE